jgi:prepilin-type N-terminal cleavage/methylation domain-containing protein
MIFSRSLKLKGFTLIEMLVSISMIVVIATLFIANYRSANKRTDLIMAAQTLVADLHLAQNNSLGLVKYNGEVPFGGWGVNFVSSTTSYTLFADLNAPDDPSGYMKYDEGEGEVNYGARVRTLPANIIISNIKTISVPSEAYANVTFLPPNPQTNIYNGTATSSSLEIELKESRNNTVKTVVVNFLGLIEVRD